MTKREMIPVSREDDDYQNVSLALSSAQHLIDTAVDKAVKNSEIVIIFPFHAWEQFQQSIERLNVDANHPKTLSQVKRMVATDAIQQSESLGFDDLVAELSDPPLTWIPYLIQVLIGAAVRRGKVFKGLNGLVQFIRIHWSLHEEGMSDAGTKPNGL